MAHLAQRVRVAAWGASEVDGNVAFTLTKFVSTISIPHRRVDTRTGNVEALSLQVYAIDTEDEIVGALAVDGRMRMLGRLCDVQHNVDGAGWETATTVRLADLKRMDGSREWILSLEDERWMERNSELWQHATTSSFYPAEPLDIWRGLGPTDAIPSMAVRGRVVETAGNLVRVEVMAGHTATSPTVVGWLENDRVEGWDPARDDGKKNFTHARLRVGGSDYEIVTFGEREVGADLLGEFKTLLPEPGTANRTALLAGRARFRVWVIAPGGLPAGDWVVKFVTPTAPTSPELPYLVGMKGTAFGTAFGWIGVGALLKAIWDAIGVRYNTTAVDALDANISIPVQAPRAESAIQASKWIEENIYGPYRIIPFRDPQGRLAPKSISLPQSVDPDELFEFGPSNLEAVPTWDHTSQGTVNRIRFEYDQLTPAEQRVYTQNYSIGFSRPVSSDWNLDGVSVRERDQAEDGDTQEVLGVHEQVYKLKGVQSPSEWPNWFSVGGWFSPVPGAIADISREVFDRRQDGPIRGHMRGTAATADVEEGDLVRIVHPRFPDPVNNQLGGERIVQILSKAKTPAGPDFEFEDVGPTLQPMAQPTIAITLPNSREVQVEVTSAPAGSRVTVEIGFGDGASAPEAWALRFTDLQQGMTVRAPAAWDYTRAFARARATAPNRIRSAWTAPVSVLLASVPRVVNAELVITGSVATVNWETNSVAEGMRLTWGRFPLAGDVVFEPEDTFDIAASAGVFQVTLENLFAGEGVQFRLQPWSGFSGGAVTGTAGPTKTVSAWTENEAITQLLRLLNFGVKEEDHRGKLFGWDPTPLLGWTQVLQATLELPLPADFNPLKMDPNDERVGVTVLDGPTELEHFVPLPRPKSVTFLEAQPWTRDRLIRGPVERAVIHSSTTFPDSIIFLVVEGNHVDGSARISAITADLVRSVRLTIIVDPDPPTPEEDWVETTPLVLEAVDGQVQHDLPPGSIGLGHQVVVGMLGYVLPDGTGPGGVTDHGPLAIARWERTPFRAPTLETVFEGRDPEDATQGLHTVRLDNPDEVPVVLYYRTRKGANATPTAWAVKASPPDDATQYSESTELEAAHDSYIDFLLEGSLGGAPFRHYRPSNGISLGRIPTLSIVPRIFYEDGVAQAYTYGNTDLDEVHILAGANEEPTDGDVLNATPIPRGQTGNLISGLSAGDVVIYKGRGVGVDGDLSADFEISAAQVTPVQPTMTRTRDEVVGSTAFAGVRVRDIAGIAAHLEFRTRSSPLAAWSAWATKANPADPGVTSYEESIAVTGNRGPQIEFRLTYTLMGQTDSISTLFDFWLDAVAPEIQVSATRNGSLVTVALNVADAQLRVTALQYNERPATHASGGSLSGWTSWTGGTGTIGVSTALARSRVISVDSGLGGEFGWRVTYTDGNGVSRTVEDWFTPGNLEEEQKSMRINSSQYFPATDTQTWATGGGLNPRVGGNTSTFGLGLPFLAPGTVIREMHWTVNAGGGSDHIQCTLFGGGSTIVDVSASSGGEQTIGNGALAHTVSSADPYNARAIMTMDATISTVALLQTRIVYDVPGYVFTI